ncbi:IS66 family transposase [Paraburkholderia fungorum]|uniref:IS66 family transposase n=1 Tax=Paraburkholderia fungorum TaxID=134537 RepID=UPI00402B9E40
MPSGLPAEWASWAQALVARLDQLATENCALKERVLQQAETIRELRDEIAVLKGQKGRPVMKPSRMDKETGQDKDAPSGAKGRGKRLNAGQPAKTVRLNIHEERTMAAVDIPDGSRFLGHRAFTVQDLRIGPHNTRFLLERWATPDGRVLTAACPPELGGLHFGPGLRAFILYQHHHCHVTQPKLHEQLLEWGLDISVGQIDALLAFGQDAFATEKASLLRTGLAVSSAITVDDSGARHQGKNGYVTVVSSPGFAWFGSADNKSRIGFLTHLHDGKPSYVMNDLALRHLRKQGLKAAVIACLQTIPFAGDDWAAYLDRLDIRDERHRRIATEAGLLGALVSKGFHPMLAIVSDGAGQFDVLEHGLCWVHTERLVHKLIPAHDAQRREQERVRGEIWAYYAELKAYRAAPEPDKAAALGARFDTLFAQRTGWATLDRLLRRILQRKDDLLRVLTRPDMPLHTNASETDIRDYVKVRKISGGTRSDLGRQCRDTFASLKKTCRKLGVSFWAYLTDRITCASQVPPLADLMRQRVA